MLREAFSSKVVLDEDSAFEAVLTDIPLFCVGLMAMGFITFIFTMNRANSTALYLCTASLLLFIAAILDLGRLLISGPTKVAQNVDPSVAPAFVVAREVGLGLSSGFLFLFIWMAVAQRPKSEQTVYAQESAQDAPRSPLHSASWKRWGLVGLGLKWLTLLLAILISLLQILWRIVTTQRRYGSLYIAESTLEIVASTIFLLKIVLNVLLSSGRWWTAFRPYIALVLALVITAGMGAGNLIAFAFSETILGRFIRAISIYILLLYSLIRTFDKPNVPRLAADDYEIGLATVQHEKPKDLAAKTTDLKPAPVASVEITRPSLHVSASSRFSALVSHAEKREALAELTRTITSKSTRRLSIAPITSPKKPRKSDLHFDIITPALPSATEAPNTPGENRGTGISLTYYTMNFGPSETPTTPIVPGLYNHPITSPSPADGQYNGETIPRISPVNQPPGRLNPSFTSFDELMRQQNELDRSIANLRLLSIDTGYARPPEAAPALEISPLGRDTVASAKSTLRTDSLSQHSEFSLSVFPLPPPPPESVRGDKRSSIPKFLLRKLPQPPVRPPSQVQLSPSIRDSSFQNNVSVRLTSAGTQYDVTSFIDDLAEPPSMETTGTLPPSALNDGAADVPHTGEPNGEPGSVLRNPTSNLKPMFLPSVASERRNFPTPNMRFSRSETQTPSQHAPRNSSVNLKPFLLGTTVSTVPVSLPSSTMVALGPHRTGRMGRVAAHKSQISSPMIDLSDSTEETPGAYERPRPPPLFGLPDSSKT